MNAIFFLYLFPFFGDGKVDFRTTDAAIWIDSPEKITHPQFWLSLAALDSWSERVNRSRVTRHVQNKTLHTYRNRQNCHIMDWTMRSQICETINARGTTSEITFVLYLKIKFWYIDITASISSLSKIFLFIKNYDRYIDWNYIQLRLPKLNRLM